MLPWFSAKEAAVVRIELMIDHRQKRIFKAAYVPIFVAAARLITQVEDEDLLETKTGETRGKKTRTLEDEKEDATPSIGREDKTDKTNSAEPPRKLFLTSARLLFLRHAGRAGQKGRALAPGTCRPDGPTEGAPC